MPTKTKRKRRPAKGALTYYRVRNARGQYRQDLFAMPEWGRKSTARLYSTRGHASNAAKPDGAIVEPVRVVPLTDAKRNKHRTR